MHVVVAGGGVAGLEAILALSALAEGLVDVELVSPAEDFVYRPMLVAEPFGNADVLTVDIAEVVRDAGARHTKAALVAVDPTAHTITTDGGATIGYEVLLVALGARPREAVPGALTFGGDAERRRFADLLSELGRRTTKRLAFVVPPTASWSIAAYELALLTAAERDARRLHGTEIALVTHEAAPLDLFGSSTSKLVAARLEEAGISLLTSTRAESFVDGRLLVGEGPGLPADAVVALPALEVPPLRGLPQREHGFLQTDVGMQVTGMETVWAAGDATWFPIKQGGLAAQQADVAARAIAARAGAHVPIEPFQPVLRGALITGSTPEFFRASAGGLGSDVAVAGRPLWAPATKLAGRYLSPYIARVLGESQPGELADRDPSADADADQAEHDRAVSLILAAADGDARIGDFEGALKWLSLVEQLNLVIPAEHVARRFEWRRQLHPELPVDDAAARIDPSFVSATAALSDLQRRIGWLREVEHQKGGEMREHLSRLDDDMEHLLALTRRTGILRDRRSDESR